MSRRPDRDDPHEDPCAPRPAAVVALPLAVIIGLGTVWILDGLEVTIVGSVSGQIGMKGSGVNISAANISGLAASLYVAGACVGRSSSGSSPTASDARSCSWSRWPCT